MRGALIAWLAGTAALMVAVPAAALPLGLTDSGQPTRYDIVGEPGTVAGYRGATWGMTPTEVRAVVARDFPGAKIGRDVTDPVLKTKAFVVGVKALAPKLTAAGITYVFGATSGRLIHVNVDWQYPAATAADRTAILAAGAAATAEYIGHFWKFGSEAHGVVVAVNSIVLFAGADQKGNRVEIRVQGVPYDLKRAGAVPGTPAVHVDPPPGQALLHIGLSRSDIAGDLYAIKPGDF